MAGDAPIAGALTRALARDPFYARIFAAIPSGVRPDAYFLAAMDEARRAGWVDPAPDGASGAAVWIERDDADAAAARRTRVRDHLGEEALSTYSSLVASMSAVCGPHLPAEAVYLSILGVAPDAQGDGLGGRLLAKGLSRVDAQARPASLETFNVLSVPFYERYGFRVASEVTEPITGCAVWVMVRPAGRV